MFTQIISKKYLRTLTVLHGALVLGQLLFAGIALLALNGRAMDSEKDDINNMFLVMALLVVGGAIGMGTFLFKTKLKEIQQSNNLRQKLGDYSTALIIRFAMLEAASIFCVVAYFFTCNFIFIGLVLVLVATFVVLRPTKANVLRDLELA
ncbi:MAG: hypothetical protein NT150_11470 [Bacteroidetes bacterium]|nr:hypothetical protein [Bacteroidota bacterium]